MNEVAIVVPPVSPKPPVVTTSAELRTALAAARGSGKSIGLVPTMGALHAGHLSLVEASCRECDFTVLTIFVNPAQFGPHEDFQKYPRTLAADLELLRQTAVDLVFAPPADEIYQPGHATYIEMKGAAEPLEGACRPGHFRGVATIVLKLFNLVMPERAYFGQKDYQQCLVVRRMAADLDLQVEVRMCPIVREADGLALSSRNIYLSEAERGDALALHRSLGLARQLVSDGECDAGRIESCMLDEVARAPRVRLEYLVLVDPATLEPVRRIDRVTLAAAAAFVGRTRLIDNELIPVPEWSSVGRHSPPAERRLSHGS